MGNLPWSIDNTKLAELYGKYPSVVSATIINDKQTDRSRGFGFVEFSDDSEALKAIEETNEMDVDGRKLVVNEARPREDNRDH